MTTLRAPDGLDVKGAKLWSEMTALCTFNPAEQVLLEEACRIADRLDRLAAVLNGDADDWLRLVASKGNPDRQEVVVDGALSEARQQANQLKQLIASLRIPDAASGARPQQRGGARGAYKSSGAGAAKVTSMDKFRQASG